MRLQVSALPRNDIQLKTVRAKHIEEMAQKLVEMNCLSFSADQKTKRYSKQILSAMKDLEMRQHIEHHLTDRPVLQTPKRLMAYANRLDDALHSDGEEFLPWKALGFIERQIEQLWKDSEMFKTLSDFHQPDQDPRRWGWYALEHPEKFRDEVGTKAKVIRAKNKTKPNAGMKKKRSANHDRKPVTRKTNGAATRKQANSIVNPKHA